MNENMKLFLKKLSENAELQESFKAITNPDEAYALASSIQSGFTKDEFIATMQALKEKLDTAEVTEEDLAKAAGGEDSDMLVVTLVSTGLSLTVGGAVCAVAAS